MPAHVCGYQMVCGQQQEKPKRCCHSMGLDSSSIWQRWECNERRCLRLLYCSAVLGSGVLTPAPCLTCSGDRYSCTHAGKRLWHRLGAKASGAKRKLHSVQLALGQSTCLLQVAVTHQGLASLCGPRQQYSEAQHLALPIWSRVAQPSTPVAALGCFKLACLPMAPYYQWLHVKQCKVRG